MYLKNTAGQHLPFALVNATTGAALTGATCTVKRCIDGGDQADATGSVTEKAGGQYDLALSQADVNGNQIGILITASGAIPVHFTLVTEDSVATSFADRLLTRDWTSITATVAARSVLNALRFLRNKWYGSGGDIIITKEDDSTEAWRGTPTTDAGANPVTAFDPST